MQMAGVALVLGFGPEAGDAATLVVGVEGQVQADGAPSRPMGLSMPHTKHMRELGCFSMMLPPCAYGIIASPQGLGKRLWCKAMGSRGGVKGRRLDLALRSWWQVWQQQLSAHVACQPVCFVV
jgi:hypothetical protein